jgi:hypothetical protein
MEKYIFTEENVEELANKFLLKSKDKIKEIISYSFYEYVGYLYEHFNNHKDKIEGELIDQITETYIKDPTQYKFRRLREKMFNENKEAITKVLSDEAIQESVENVIKEYTSREYTFNWQWKDAIKKIILQNLDVWVEDDRVKEGLLREISNQKEYIKQLKERLGEIQQLSN